MAMRKILSPAAWELQFGKLAFDPYWNYIDRQSFGKNISSNNSSNSSSNSNITKRATQTRQHKSRSSFGDDGHYTLSISQPIAIPSVMKKR
jgi:hypothetical protein